MLLRYLVHIQIYFLVTWFIYKYTSEVPGSYTDILLRYQVNIHIYFLGTRFIYNKHIYYSGTWFTCRYTS